MAKVVLYIAASLDGYIARKDGAIDWLPEVGAGGEDYGYSKFYQSVDALVMGRKTYEQALGFGTWPYPGKPSYVFTRRKPALKNSGVTFTRKRPDRVVSEIKDRGLKNIWLVGGGRLNAAFLRLGLIDEWIITFIPVILGEGIPIFVPPYPDQALRIVRMKRFPDGLVQMTYRKGES